ncbi:universal stress protein [Halodesulfovibrio spirochaetisodalis]|uniref:Universal stress protein n=1 Tax=Halodesulfovibrio spirochaetisodalis TaxID=1560234 RepID=A0A1B7XCM6_9BACT|nr:universal stress protein [Halodesulfovibrio spirochaetisodalis]OBQ51712.1 universal stress protein [Halodesulfovibrio spirochaetisodalis]
MRTIKHILVAVDLMEDSSFVAKYAKLFAERLNATITVVYATPPLSQYFGLYLPQDTISKFHEDSEKGAIRELAKFVESNFAGADVVQRLANGHPQDVILGIAKESNADLIIMGTHSRRGVDRIMFGSVASHVVKLADIPVLTVRPEK